MKLIIQDNVKGAWARIRIWENSKRKPSIDVVVVPHVAIAAIQAVQGIVKRELDS